jgi:hypothetical protein
LAEEKEQNAKLQKTQKRKALLSELDELKKKRCQKRRASRRLSKQQMNMQKQWRERGV